MYFETGQGSVLSANNDFGADQQTSPATPIPNFSQLKVTLLTMFYLLRLQSLL